MITLTLFDLDGTLAHRDKGELLAGVARHFTLRPPARWAIVTNQGGVGLRRWMEDNGFGDPDRYPAAEDIDARIVAVIAAIGKQPIGVYAWRKPSPGMLLQAMADAGVADPANVLMVGDSDADQQAAEAAGMQFRWADEYFERVYSLRPSNPRTVVAVKLTHDDNTIYAETPRFLDGLGDVLKGQTMKWDEVRGRWYRELLPRHGAPVDRLIECAVHLLAARFPVNVSSDDLRRRVAERDYTPEQTRWLLARTGGKRAGQLVAQWGRTESFSKHLYRIPGVTVYEREAFFPPELWDVALDFAAAHGFSISESAQRILDDARRAYESAYVVDVEPLPPIPAKPADRPQLSAEIDFGIDEDYAMTWQTTTNLLPWQQRGVEKVKRSRVAALFMDPGTGKTRTAIELTWLRQDQISKVVWFCPVSLMTTIQHEILKHTDCAPEQIYVFGDRTTQRTLPPAIWYIVGIESMGQSDRVTLAVNALIDADTMVVVDESTYIKGHSAKRTLRITRLCDKARYRLILTGTPLTQGVVDLYAQMRFLSPKILGYNSFYSFAANHLEYSEDYPGMIVRTHNTDWLAAKINPYVYQVTKGECMDLPPKLTDSLFYQMTMAQAELYWRAKEEILLSAPDDELLESYTIFRLFTALQQIVCGFWNRYPDPPEPPGKRSRHWSDEDWQRWHIVAQFRREPELITVPHRRLNMLCAAIDGSEAERIIIWANHQHAIADIVERLADVHGEGAVAQFHGGIAPRERETQLERWRRSARFLVMTQATGGHGLTLNEGTHHIFYSNGFKFSERLQAEDRSHRIGQTKPVTYTDLVCMDSIDVRVQKALSDKEDTLSAFRRDVNRFKDADPAGIRRMLGKL